MVILQVLLFLMKRKTKKHWKILRDETLIKSNNEKIMKFNISGLRRYSKIR